MQNDEQSLGTSAETELQSLASLTFGTNATVPSFRCRWWTCTDGPRWYEDVTLLGGM